MNDLREAEEIANGLELGIHLRSAALAPHDEDELVFWGRRAKEYLRRHAEDIRNSLAQ